MGIFSKLVITGTITTSFVIGAVVGFAGGLAFIAYVEE